MWKLHEIQISLSINKTLLEHGFTHLFTYLWLFWVVAVEIVRPAKPKIFTYLILFTRSLPTSILKDGKIWRSLEIPELAYLTEMGILCFGSGYWFLMFSSVVQLRPTLCDPMDWTRQASLSITNSWGLPILVSIESVMPSNHLILCQPLLLLPSIFPSIRVFSSESALRIKWPKYWSFQLQHQSFQWIFRTDFL